MFILTETRIVLQMFTLIAALVFLALLIYWTGSHRSQWGYAAPPISWLLHLSALYLVAFAREFFGFSAASSSFLIFWTIVVILHGVFIIGGVALLLIFERVIFASNHAES